MVNGEWLGDLDGGRQVVGEGGGAVGESIHDCDLKSTMRRRRLGLRWPEVAGDEGHGGVGRQREREEVRISLDPHVREGG
jgi:hypothetical protein